MIRKYLKKIFPSDVNISKTRPFENGSVRHIAEWIDYSKIFHYKGNLRQIEAM